MHLYDRINWSNRENISFINSIGKIRIVEMVRSGALGIIENGFGS